MEGAELQAKIRDYPMHTRVYFCDVCDRKTWWLSSEYGDSRRCLECESARRPCFRDCEHPECPAYREAGRSVDRSMRVGILLFWLGWAVVFLMMIGRFVLGIAALQ